MLGLFVIALPAASPNTFTPESQSSIRSLCSPAQVYGEKGLLMPSTWHANTVNVAVVVPCFQQTDTVADTLGSVLTQSARPRAVVVVDDDPDGGHQCGGAVQSTAGVSVVRNPRNLGLAATRNAALELPAVKGAEYVLYLDADDLLAPGALAALWETAQLTNASVVTADQILFKSDYSGSRWEVGNEIDAMDMVERGALPVPNLIRVAEIARRGGFETAMIFGMEDRATWYRLLSAGGTVAKAAGVGSCYRLKEKSMSHSADYSALAGPMFTVYSQADRNHLEVANAMSATTRGLRKAAKAGPLLAAAVAARPTTCFGYIMLALWQRSQGCTIEEVGIANCERAVRAGLAAREELVTMRRMMRSSSAGSTTARRHYIFEDSGAPPRMPPCPEPRYVMQPLSAFPYVHFVVGLAPGYTFTWVAYVAVLSAHRAHRPEVVFLHHRYPPKGRWWQLLKAQPWVRIVRHGDETARTADGRCIAHYAHRADLLRLEVLRRHGGLYLDADVVSVRPLPQHAADAAFVIGEQLSQPWGWRKREGVTRYGLCNAIMWATPDSAFLALLIDSYSSFRSLGRDDKWDEHSVRLPAELLEQCPDRSVSILPNDAFFQYLWDDNDQIWGRRFANHTALLDNPLAVGFHLWGAQGREVRAYATLDEICRAEGGSIAGAVACMLDAA